METYSEKIIKLLNEFRVIKDEDSCYGWIGAICGGGFGRININDQSVGAHRVAWEAHNGPIYGRGYVMHSCENRTCTNPKHLSMTRDNPARIRHHERKTSRLGRERLNVDLPSRLVNDIRSMALKHNITITKYVGKRLSEVIEYEKSLEKK